MSQDSNPTGTNDREISSTETESPSSSEQRTAVRERYGSIPDTSDQGGCCGETNTTESGSCGDESSSTADSVDDAEAVDSLAETLGYSRAEIERVAEGANFGLGCGNPNAIADLTEGQTVLDLGSGGGFDCFLGANEVGEDGHVIGVDMTPEMIEQARANIEKNDAENVEFRLGEIENLPVRDEYVDVIISNCVINLSPDKQRVFEEAYRVLRPGGRLAIADVVMTASPPEGIRDDLESIAACVGGAATIAELEAMIEGAGFESVSIQPKDDSDEFIETWSDEYSLETFLVSAVIEAEKPR